MTDEAKIKTFLDGSRFAVVGASANREKYGNKVLRVYQQNKLDVVPVNPGTESDWEHGPFGGVVADGFIWGRGAMDDKGSLIAILEAADALAASGWTPKRTVLLAFGHDEEVSGDGARETFALLKSRGVTPMMVLDEGFFVLKDNPITGKPTAMVGVAEKGSVSMSIDAPAAVIFAPPALFSAVCVGCKPKAWSAGSPDATVMVNSVTPLPPVNTRRPELADTKMRSAIATESAVLPSPFGSSKTAVSARLRSATRSPIVVLVAVALLWRTTA